MYDICYSCDEPYQDEGVGPDQIYTCPRCGFRQRFQAPTMFIITGVSGTGKTTLWSEMLIRKDKPDLVYLDSDMLLPLNQFIKEEYWSYWMWIGFKIAQSGRPVALFGWSDPSNHENASQRKHFSAIHYLVLTCDPVVLERRLRERPEWRGSSKPEFIKMALDANQRFIDTAAKTPLSYTLLDTTNKTREECVTELMNWINRHHRQGRTGR